MGTTNVEPMEDYTGVVALAGEKGFSFNIVAGEITTEDIEKGNMIIPATNKQRFIIDDKNQAVIIEYFADGKRARVVTEEEERDFLEKQQLDEQREGYVQAEITQEDIEFVKKETGIALEFKELNKIATKIQSIPSNTGEATR